MADTIDFKRRTSKKSAVGQADRYKIPKSLKVRVISTRTGKDDQAEAKRIRQNNATSVVSEEVARQARSEGVTANLGKFSVRGAVFRAGLALGSLGDSDRAQATRAGIKADEIKYKRKRRKK